MLTKQQLEKIAKKYCQELDLDPDEWVIDETDNTMASTEIQMWVKIMYEIKDKLKEERERIILQRIIKQVEEEG